ncbi:MAG: hypothetical protein ABR525_04720 [Candidatus Limnocylindria bacterium]
MSARARFMTVAAVVLALLFVVIVLLPAVARGGLEELLLVGAAFAFVLLFERYLRTR